MGFPEFVVVIASIMALNPLAMDMMLPALPDIRSAFGIADANLPQMVLSTFLIGFGAGLAWQSRDLGRCIFCDAVKSINKTRDDHWFEKNPIDYA